MFVGIAVIMFRTEGISLISARAYAGAAAVIPPLVVAFLFLLGSSLCDASFYVASRTGKRVLIAVVSSVLFLAMYALLVPRDGGIGAAWTALSALP